MRRTGTGRTRGASPLLSVVVSSLACQDIAPPQETFEPQEPFRCVEDSQCGDAECDLELGECVVREVGYDEVLLQVSTETTEIGFGGAQFYKPLQQLTGSPAAAARFDIPAPVRVNGTVNAFYVEGISCPLSVRLTFIPHESFLGLSTIRYTTISTRFTPPDKLAAVNRFSLPALPVGIYDIYWEDSGLVTETAGRSHLCEVVPQLFRRIPIAVATDIALGQATPDSVRVEIPWQHDLEGWRVDAIHPVTGQRVSTQRTLSENCPDDPLARWVNGEVCAPVQETDTGERIAVATLRIANINDDYGSPDQELLRLRPPPGVHRPTTFFVLLPLITVEGGPAQVPGPIETFAQQRELELWVWQEGDAQRPVSGHVEFVASALADEPDTVYQVRFKRSVPIGADGKVAVALPPGVYVARVYPATLKVSNFETGITVWGPADGTDESGVQAGRVLAVPAPAKVSGRVRLPGGLDAEGTQVRLLGGRSGGGVLSDGVLTARGRTGLAEADGTFEVADVDCDQCAGGAGLTYSVRVAPPHSVALPWFIRSPIAVRDSSVSLGILSLTFPKNHFGHLGVLRANSSLGEFRGPPLIRAYVLLGRDDNPVPADARSCVVAAGSPSPCATRAVQVAETRANSDGSFRLALPPWPVSP